MNTQWFFTGDHCTSAVFFRRRWSPKRWRWLSSSSRSKPQSKRVSSTQHQKTVGIVTDFQSFQRVSDQICRVWYYVTFRWGHTLLACTSFGMLITHQTCSTSYRSYWWNANQPPNHVKLTPISWVFWVCLSVLSFVACPCRSLHRVLSTHGMSQSLLTLL